MIYFSFVNSVFLARISCVAICGMLLFGVVACQRSSRKTKPAPASHLTVEAKQTAELSDNEYLMRKATLGSRAERLEALDVIDRANDPKMFEFLLERLKKEDDRFIQIRVMHALANTGDARAISPLRYFARWDQTRVGVEAIAALYALGDDSFIPRLIMKLRPNEDQPEMSGIAHRALKKLMDTDLPPNPRAWLNYYRSHRLAPYESRTWFWPFRPPLPPTIEGTTKIAPQAKGKLPLPDKDMRVRRTNITWYDFWRSDEP